MLQTSQGRRNATSEKNFIIWLEDLRKGDILVVGGKNANLGEMIHAGMPVPPGFAITAYAYEKFIVETGISERIYSILKETVTDVNNPRQFDDASKHIRALIESTAMP